MMKPENSTALLPSRLSTAARALFSVAAIVSLPALALDKEPNQTAVDWGSCPCVQVDAAWNRMPGIRALTAGDRYELESVDQSNTVGYFRSTNNIIDNSVGMAALIGEIDVVVLPGNDTLQCSSYRFNDDAADTSIHNLTNAGKAVADCRAGLYELAEQINPLPPQS